jgi:hypothetical protein
MQLKVNREFAVGINEVPISDVPFLLTGNVIRDFLKINNKAAQYVNETDFILYNNLGQQMNVGITHHHYIITVDMRALKPGIYYLRYNGKRAATCKVLKL